MAENRTDDVEGGSCVAIGEIKDEVKKRWVKVVRVEAPRD